MGHTDDLVATKLTRRQMVEKLVAGIAAGAAWPLIASAHPIQRHLKNAALLDRADEIQNEASWKPLFLNPPQNETLVALAETMVPGATDARVNRFIDLLLSVDTVENRNKFSASLAAFDNIAQKHFGQAFRQLNVSDRNLALTKAANGNEHQEAFNQLKGWITTAYYSSEQGMRELGWTGHRAFRTFPGCAHESSSEHGL